MTDTDLLREAAALMRQHAQAATPGPWQQSAAYGWDVRDVRGRKVLGAHNGNESVAEHAASWHPAVALAVADWLDREAAIPTWHDQQPHPKAVAVARAYLGRDGG